MEIQTHPNQAWSFLTANFYKETIFWLEWVCSRTVLISCGLCSIRIPLTTKVSKGSGFSHSGGPVSDSGSPPQRIEMSQGTERTNWRRICGRGRGRAPSSSGSCASQEVRHGDASVRYFCCCCCCWKGGTSKKEQHERGKCRERKERKRKMLRLFSNVLAKHNCVHMFELFFHVGYRLLVWLS